MNLKPFAPIFSVLTNKFSWAAIGLLVGYFGLSSTSPEWSALVDIGVAVASVLLALTKEKGQSYVVKKESVEPEIETFVNKSEVPKNAPNVRSSTASVHSSNAQLSNVRVLNDSMSSENSSEDFRKFEDSGFGDK